MLPTKTQLKALLLQKQTHENPNMRPIHPAYGDIGSIKLDIRETHKADPDDEHDMSSVSGAAVIYLKNTKPIERPIYIDGYQVCSECDHTMSPDDYNAAWCKYAENRRPFPCPNCGETDSFETEKTVHVKVIYGEFHWEDDDSIGKDNWRWLGIAFDNQGDLDTSDPDYIDFKESGTKSDITEYCLRWV